MPRLPIDVMRVGQDVRACMDCGAVYGSGPSVDGLAGVSWGICDPCDARREAGLPLPQDALGSYFSPTGAGPPGIPARPLDCAGAIRFPAHHGAGRPDTPGSLD